MSDSRRSETVLCLTLAGCVALGALIAESTMPVLFGHAPTELSRTRTLFRALRSPDLVQPRLVVLGSSIVMSGIDAKQLAAGLGLQQPVWNLASTGQQLSESLMVADALPSSVSTVVVGIGIDDLRVGGYDPLSLSKYCAYPMNGYHPSAEARVLGQSHPSLGLQPLFAMSSWEVAAAARWVFRSSADLLARSAIRKDLDLDRARDDLFHPIPYSHKMTPEEIDFNVRAVYHFREAFVPSADAAGALVGLRDMLRLRGKKLVVIILPEHPKRAELCTPRFYPQFETWLSEFQRQFGIEVVDCHDALPSDEFVDHIHPGLNGATHLTSLLSQHLRHKAL